MTVTRRDLRRSVAHMLDDYALGTDTAGGHTGQLTDLTTFARENGFYNGMQIFFCNDASPHYGIIATVTNSDGPTRTIFFEPPLPFNSIPGEQVEMYNFDGRGSTKTQYDRSIHDAVAIARENHALIPLIVTASDAFSTSSPQVTIPADFTSISGIRFTQRNGQYKSLAPQSFTVDRISRTITMKDRFVSGYNGLAYAFVGYGEQALPQSDDDVILIDTEWLFNEVKAQILERKVASGANIGASDRLYLQERTESGMKRPLIVARAQPNTKRLFS